MIGYTEPPKLDVLHPIGMPTDMQCTWIIQYSESLSNVGFMFQDNNSL